MSSVIDIFILNPEDVHSGSRQDGKRVSSLSFVPNHTESIENALTSKMTIDPKILNCYKVIREMGPKSASFRATILHSPNPSREEICKILLELETEKAAREYAPD